MQHWQECGRKDGRTHIDLQDAGKGRRTHASREDAREQGGRTRSGRTRASSVPTMDGVDCVGTVLRESKGCRGRWRGHGTRPGSHAHPSHPGTDPPRFDTKTDANATPVHSRDAPCVRPVGRRASCPIACVLWADMRPARSRASCGPTCVLSDRVRPVGRHASCPIACVLWADVRPARSHASCGPTCVLPDRVRPPCLYAPIRPTVSHVLIARLVRPPRRHNRDR
jgi:hypothetical protein